VDVAGGALLRTPRGVPVHLSFGFEHAYKSTYALWGSLGELAVDQAFTPPPDLRPVLHVTRMDLHKELTVPSDNQFTRICDEFARSVLDGHGFDQAYIDIVRQATLVDAVRDVAQRVVS
jgi:NDP-hexose-3-ketoreductase